MDGGGFAAEGLQIADLDPSVSSQGVGELAPKAPAPAGRDAALTAQQAGTGPQMKLQWLDQRYRLAGPEGPQVDPNASGVEIGVNYKLQSILTIGALAQVNPAAEMLLGGQHSLLDQGWMAGPVTTIRLAPGLVLNARAAALNALNRHCVGSLMPLVRWAGVEDLIRVPGQLYLYMRRESYENDRLVNALRVASGEAYDVLDKGAIREMEPDLAPVFEVALRAHGNGHCRNPHRLATALAERVAREGGQVLRAEVNGLDIEDGEISAVRTDRGAIRARAVVVAAGMWSRSLARLLGHRVPLESQRGYHVTIAEPGPAPRNMLMVLDKKIAITPMETGLRIAGTVELAGLDALPNYRRAEIFLDMGKAIIPGLRTERRSEWMGHRPCLPDSLPVIGRSPRVRNAYFAFGHGHLGLIGSAPTGRIIAQLVTGQAPMIDLDHYRIDRF